MIKFYHKQSLFDAGLRHFPFLILLEAFLRPTFSPLFNSRRTDAKVYILTPHVKYFFFFPVPTIPNHPSPLRTNFQPQLVCSPQNWVGKERVGTRGSSRFFACFLLIPAPYAIKAIIKYYIPINYNVCTLSYYKSEHIKTAISEPVN